MNEYFDLRFDVLQNNLIQYDSSFFYECKDYQSFYGDLTLEASSWLSN